MIRSEDMELYAFLLAVEGLTDLDRSLGRLYDSVKPFDFEKNNPAVQLSYALAHGYGILSISGETFKDEMKYWDERFGRTHPLFHGLIERVRGKFSLLERAVLDNVTQEEVKRIGRVSQHLDYLYKPQPRQQEVVTVASL